MKKLSTQAVLMFITTLTPCLAQSEQEPNLSDIEITETCSNPMLRLAKKKSADGQGLTEAVNIFIRHDINKDNKVCLDEVREIDPRTIPKWGAFDLNADLCITPSEAKTVIEREIKTRWKRQYRSFDLNRDGDIQIHELELKLRDQGDNGFNTGDFLQVYDINFNNLITEDEFIQGSIEYLRDIRSQIPKAEVHYQGKLRESYSPPTEKYQSRSS
ncbi:MAG: hypothetical protein RPS47_04715 [Colwellia sp.]|jgi:hypothetical protein